MKLPQIESDEDFFEYFPTEEACREYLEQIKWPEGPVCPHCDYREKIYKLRRKGVYRCGGCRKDFTVLIGTIFERSHVSLRKWFRALLYISTEKKGISSVRLAKRVKVTQRTAWFMLHRVRYMISQTKHGENLVGVVQMDELYLGGKAKKGDKKRRVKRGSGSQNRTPIIGMLDSEGKVCARPVIKTDKFTLETAIKLKVVKGSIVVTDEHGSYSGVEGLGYGHKTVNHTQGEYVTEDGATTNTIEGFWGLMKRGFIGIYHKMSPKHLDLYCDEFTFRYSTMKMSDFNRFNKALSKCDGRITYRDLTTKPDPFNRKKKSPKFGQGLLEHDLEEWSEDEWRTRGFR